MLAGFNGKSRPQNVLYFYLFSWILHQPRVRTEINERHESCLDAFSILISDKFSLQFGRVLRNNLILTEFFSICILPK